MCKCVRQVVSTIKITRIPILAFCRIVCNSRVITLYPVQTFISGEKAHRIHVVSART